MAISYPGRVEARVTVPVGGAAFSVSDGARATAVTITTPAGNYYLTEASGVDSLLTTLQTDLRNNVQSYPQTAAAMQAAIGYGTWTAGWLINETSGNLAAAFGSPTLTAVSSPTYSVGYQQGIDKAIGFDSAADAFSGGDVHDVTGTDDLVLSWVGYVSANPSGSVDWFSKGSGVACWYVFRRNTGALRLTLNDAVDIETTTAVPTGEWHGGIAVVNRATNRARIGCIGLTSGTVSISAEVDISAQGTLANASSLVLGSGTIASADTDLKLCAFYIGTGTAAGTGLSANLSTALTNWRNCIAANWSVSMSTSTGLVTIGHGFWPSYVQFTDADLRDQLGFESDFDYPADAAALTAALGNYGTFTSGFGLLCNETSGSLVPAFGTPAAFTASGTVTYSNPGARGGGDLAVGMAATTDHFSGGDVHDVTTADDLAIVWVSRFSSAPNGTKFFGKGTGSTGYWLQTSATGIKLSTADGGVTVPTAEVSVHAGEHYVGIATIDRSTGLMRIATQGLTSGTQSVSATTAPAAGTLANASNLCVGYWGGGGAGNTNATYSAVYLAAGVGVATGLSANISAALTSIAASMKSATGTAQSPAVWFPDCPLNLDSDPSRAPRTSDKRDTEGPTGIMLSLVGNYKYRHKNIVWSHVPINRTWEAEAEYDNGSWEAFVENTQLGLGSSWFRPGSPVQIYWSNAGTDALVGSDANDGAGVSGWYLKGIDGTEVQRVDANGWTGLWRIEIKEIVSPG